MSQRWSDMDAWERRTLLKTLGPAGLGLIAGCISDDGDGAGDDGGDADDTTDDDDGADDGDGGTDDSGDTDLVDPRDYVIEGQTLRIPSPLNEDPGVAFFIHRDVGRDVYDVPGEAALDAMHVSNGHLASGPGFHDAFNLEYHDPVSHFYEGDADTIWQPEIVRTEIHEDATWSDGEPVRAFDCLPGMLGNGCTGTTLPSGGFYDAARYDINFPDGPDGKVLEQIVLPSWLGDGPDNMEPPGPKEEFRGWREMAPGIVQPQTLGQFPRMGGVSINTPTHIEPFDCQTETLHEAHSFKWELIQDNPGVWNDADRYEEFIENDPDGRNELFRLWQEEAPSEWIEPWGGQICRDGAARLCVGEGDDQAIQEMYEQSRDPEWITSLGLYEIAEIVGSEGYRMVPNEEHMFYDEHTFDEVFLEWVDQEHREVAGLMSERYDSSSATLTPEEQGVLSDIYELKGYPNVAGFTLSLNHAYWPGESVYVRQGLKHATDEASIAENLNPDTNAPIHTPGWDNHGAEEFIDESWAQDNLTSYEYDLERAEELFEMAGFSRGQDDAWLDPDGQPIEENIATDEEAPVAEETIADQWRQFGIDVETLILDTSTFEDRWEGADDPLSEGVGEFAVAVNALPSENFSGFFSTAMGEVSGANTFTYRRRARNWFDVEGGHGTPDQKVEFSETSIREGFAPINYADPGSYVYPWRIPPVGQPDAPESDWVWFDHARAYSFADRGLYEFTGDLMPTNEALAGDDEGLEEEEDDGGDDAIWVHDEVFDPDALGVDNLWQAMAWSFNWMLPDLPIVAQQAESYINTANWYWGANQPEVDGLATPRDVTEQHWDFWGLGVPASRYAGNNMVWANPDNPKVNAEVTRTD